MTNTSKALLQSLLYGLLLVGALTVLGLFVSAFHYPLMPGIAFGGLLFSNDVDMDHSLRLTVAAVLVNTLFYGLAIFFLLLRPRTPRVRRRRSS